MKNILAWISFLDWWHSLSIKAQQQYLAEHSHDDSNYQIAAANQKQRKNRSA